MSSEKMTTLDAIALELIRVNPPRHDERDNAADVLELLARTRNALRRWEKRLNAAQGVPGMSRTFAELQRKLEEMTTTVMGARALVPPALRDDTRGPRRCPAIQALQGKRK